MSFIRHFLIAIQFFTRIPIDGRLADWVGFSPAMLRASAAHFPGVGWVVGGLTALVFWGLVHVLPVQPAAPWVAAVFSTAFSVWLTGAFHEDGLADTAERREKQGDGPSRASPAVLPRPSDKLPWPDPPLCASPVSFP